MTKPPASDLPDPHPAATSQAGSRPASEVTSLTVADADQTVVTRPDVGGAVNLSKNSGEGDDWEAGETGLGRPSPARAAPLHSPLPTHAEQDRPHRARFLGFLRVLGGWAVLGLLAYVMWSPGEWQNSLLLWVALVILADEFGGWFGYMGLLLGGLGYLSPSLPPAQWLIILPLVGGALMALLLVKHSGGVLVLPFAGLIFAGTLLAVARFGTKFDPTLKLPSDDVFLRSALMAMAAGLGFSLVRQLAGLYLRRRERRAAYVAQPA
ncbi:hypothetical protein [Deinococcus arenicola]|uniref:Uncharacterized protein n=1 Tax=Deinococcus arenicola TaxID=2994950 RepID=A0ABU4DR76_9DEIO|nr:hypothetical protein [Deinococcus sp. ZS9-10]MDV6374579.1 hypothetical protein [Deinococcus sp. ZS9-10]